MKIAYADPPYPGQSKKHYADHPDYAGEVDHAELIERMERDYDSWVLHTGSVNLQEILALCPSQSKDCRVMAWCKSFAAFKRNVPVAYTWEPVIVKVARPATPKRFPDLVYRDFLLEPITMKRGLTGTKPEKVCWWLFEMCGLEPHDVLDDLYPGTGAVTDAWETWKTEMACLSSST